jgi:hypothetical protein
MMSAEKIGEIRALLEDAVGLAAEIDLELTVDLRGALLDLLDELSFLEAIRRAEGAR